jgi:hypothetical protein
MNVTILDHHGGKRHASWEGNEFMGLTFTSELPGGMISCTFDIPTPYHYPHQWANVLNQVEVYNDNSQNVWSGYLYGMERYWRDSSGIRVDAVGWVSKLNQLVVSDNLSNEKGSTYINDHILAGTGSGEQLLDWIQEGKIETSDYTIPGELEFAPWTYMREAIDRIIEYNQDTRNFYIRGKHMYFVPKQTAATLETSTEFCTGSLRQDLEEFANIICYSYRDADGVVQSSYTADADSGYPITGLIEGYSDNMTAAQALTAATASLNRRKVLGATGGVTASRVWRLGGAELPISEVFPGEVIHIAGLVTAKASPAEVFTTNDVDTFEIRSVTYNHDSQTIDISPGRLPYSMSNLLAGVKK